MAIGGTEGKSDPGINNKKKPFDDVRVRRALAHAIDRKALIDGALEGLGKPIGSHMVPSDAGYVDLTGMNPYDPEKAKALLKEAGVADAAERDADAAAAAVRAQGRRDRRRAARQGRQSIAKIENVEWAQWLSGTFKGNFDLTIISHVEPLDFAATPTRQYYFGYDCKAFRDLVGPACGEQQREGAHAAARRHPAHARHRRGERLHLPAAAGGGVEEAAEGPVEQLADLRQRHGGGVLAVTWAR